MLLAAAVGLAALTASQPTLAHGPRARVSIGFAFGGPYWYPGLYHHSYYYYPAPVVVASPPPSPVYVERDRTERATPEASGWWYYCRGSNAYYPYVKQCPAGWERVSPQPPAG